MSTDPTTPDPVITHRLDPEQFDVLTNGLAMLIAELRVANLGGTVEPEPAACHHEPWQFHSPHDKLDVVAFVDDAQQVRHVPVTRADEVPKAWRRILLA